MTSTGDKYLDIAISMGPSSSVVVLIGDITGHQIFLTHATWTALFQKRATIKEFVQSTTPSPAILIILDLNMEIVKLHDEILVKLTLRDNTIHMKPSTVCFMLELEHCVQNIYYYLYQSTHTVNEKYKEFVSFLGRTPYVFNKNGAAKLLREKYDKTSLLDCELLTYALDNIVNDALGDR